jgi:putative lipase involved disintegration of autophagic bodies
MAQGDGLNVQQRFSNIEAELQRIRDVQAKFEQASQIQNERIEELERVLNPLSGNQPEVSTAPSGHERGQMCDDVSMASNNIHDSDASEDYLERESPNEDVSDGDFAKDDDGSSEGSNIYDA